MLLSMSMESISPLDVAGEELDGYAATMALLGELAGIVAASVRKTRATSKKRMFEIMLELDLENRLNIIAATLTTIAGRMGYQFGSPRDQDVVREIEYRLGTQSDPIYVALRAISDTMSCLTDHMGEVSEICAWSMSDRIHQYLFDHGREDRVIRRLRIYVQMLDAQFRQLMVVMEYMQPLEVVLDDAHPLRASLMAQ